MSYEDYDDDELEPEDEPRNLLAFVSLEGELVRYGSRHPRTVEDVVEKPGGSLRITDYDGEVFIFAAGTWDLVRIEHKESR